MEHTQNILTILEQSEPTQEDIKIVCGYISKRACELLHHCAEDGTAAHLNPINDYLVFCGQVIDFAVKIEKYDLAVQCESELEYWHLRKSNVTEKYEHSLSSFLAQGV